MRIFFQAILPSSDAGGAKKPGTEKRGGQTRQTCSLRLSSIRRETGQRLWKGVLSQHSCKAFPFSLCLSALPSTDPEQQQEKEQRQSHGQQNVSAWVKVGRKVSGDRIQDQCRSQGYSLIKPVSNLSSNIDLCEPWAHTSPLHASQSSK